MDSDLDVLLSRAKLPASAAKSRIPGGWYVPAKITLDKKAGLLCWEQDSRPPRWEVPTPEMLEMFLRLWNGSDSQILRFARQWGPLGLCSAHQLPVTHQPQTPAERARGIPGCAPIQLADGRSAEPLDAWRKTAYQAAILLGAGTYARRGELPFEDPVEFAARVMGLPADSPRERVTFALLSARDRKTWTQQSERVWVNAGSGLTVVSATEPPRVPDPNDPYGLRVFTALLGQPDALVAAIDKWIEQGGGFRSHPTLEGNLPGWRTGVRSLYSAIGVGLWNAIGGGSGWTGCHECGDHFPITNRRQKYCKACQRARKREDKRRSRANPGKKSAA